MAPVRCAEVDAYLAGCALPARRVLRKIRAIARSVAPQALEVISYKIPAFKQGKILIYYAAFKAHVSLFPPLRDNATLQRKLARYTGPKGNLRFALTEAVPYDLVEEFVRWRLAQVAGKQPRRQVGRRRKH